MCWPQSGPVSSLNCQFDRIGRCGLKPRSDGRSRPLSPRDLPRPRNRFRPGWLLTSPAQRFADCPVANTSRWRSSNPRERIEQPASRPPGYIASGTIPDTHLPHTSRTNRRGTGPQRGSERSTRRSGHATGRGSARLRPSSMCPAESGRRTAQSRCVPSRLSRGKGEKVWGNFRNL